MGRSNFSRARSDQLITYRETSVYTLQNEVLSVDVLDPVADRERFGTRYCTGGYIFQVTDANYGPLLSGPTYPDSFNTYDGQGIPDAF
ncbi:MAG: hypothetical protein VXU50_07875, partial [Verrucomicrobiota bacterium]|nr:hypothetical protein [Verrucomicrobiota bacterium]